MILNAHLLILAMNSTMISITGCCFVCLFVCLFVVVLIVFLF